MEPLNKQRRYLRRYRGRTKDESCPVKGYHDARVFMDEVEIPEEKAISGDRWPHSDPRWPTKCECGEPFRDDDYWQLTLDTVYKRTDNGEETTLRDAPAGAMWYADWMNMKGPDGHCLAVKTPAGDWLVDGPAASGGTWERTGDPLANPPTVTANPSIGIGKRDGGWAYHGFLRNGKLIDA